MSTLRELQAAFGRAVLDPAAEDALLVCLEEYPEVARRRLAAYRRSIFGNLIGALEATYPVVVRIVGKAFFGEAARRYIDAHPSASGDLNEYGGEFPDFLETYRHARELAYLPDVARLEWAVQSVYYAADPPPADLAALAATPADRYGELRFACSPVHARLDSPWPLDEIWRVNRPDYDGDMTVDFSRGSRLVVLRRDGGVHVEPLSAGEAELLDALAAGRTLAAAAQAAVAGGETDLGAALRRFVAAGLLLSASVDCQGAIHE